MSLFDFVKDFGRDLFTSDAEAGNNIQTHIENNNPGVNPISVKFDDGVVTLSGMADSLEAKEKAVLMAGNVKGVTKVIADNLRAPLPKVAEELAAKQAAAEKAAKEAAAAAAAVLPKVEYYEIVRGDSLSLIAKRYYGDPMAYKRLFEANREVIEDPDKIFPGQKIRIPLD